MYGFSGSDNETLDVWWILFSLKALVPVADSEIAATARRGETFAKRWMGLRVVIWDIAAPAGGAEGVAIGRSIERWAVPHGTSEGGTDSFAYEVCDRLGACSTAEVTVPVGTSGCTIVGTDEADTLFGTAGDDVICGFGGDDVIIGGNGNDNLYGGDATLIGATDGDDLLWGGTGDDSLYGGNGTDYLDGGPDTDTCARAQTATRCERQGRSS